MNRGKDEISGKEEDTVVGHIRNESFSALGDKGMSTEVTLMGGDHTRWLL